MLTFKRKLILNKAQIDRIERWFGVCRLVYNMCIDIRKDAWKNQQRTVHRFELDAQLTTIKDIEWIADVSADSLSQVIKRMDLAYQKFFKGGGFPKFASKKTVNSFAVRQYCHVNARAVKVPKIGWLKMVKDAAVIGKIKTITIKKQIDGYYACITTDAVKSIQCQDDKQVIGIDMGITHLAVGSDGSYIPNPKHFQTYERQLRIENRSLSRKKKGGKNWIKQVNKLRKIHNKVGNVRKDYLHKYSTAIAKENHYVMLEDLNVSGMAKNKNLSKHILDCGWSMFRTMLEYKTTVIAIDPKYTSQTCFSCGHKDEASRKSQSEFECTNCGNAMNADHNAALTILGKGITHVAQRKAIA